LDPDFLAAITTASYQLAWIHQNWDRSDAVKEEALALARKADAIDPDHEWSISAMAAYYYRIEKDYDRAMEIYDRGVQLYPENMHFLRMTAHVARRRGDWDQALEILQRAESITPSNDALQAIIENHHYNRRWDAMIAAAEEHSRRNPEATFGPSYIAWGQYYKTGDTQSIRDYQATRPATALDQNRWTLEMMDGNPAAALAVMDASDTEMFSGQYRLAPRSYYRGVALQSLGRQAEADAALLEAKEAVEAMLPELDHDCRVHAALGLIYAVMGDHDAAIEAAQHAVEMVPPEKEAMIGPHNVLNLAEVYALLGEAELAVEQIEYLFTMPSPIAQVDLEVRGIFDDIRDHPAFRALLEG
jgi:tetratricopeptide (TPR) repeat protein